MWYVQLLSVLMVYSPVTSGIFGYINYLVEKDRKFIIDTLLNGELLILLFNISPAPVNDQLQVSPDWSTVAMTPPVWP
jgi:hypothetical protein